METDQEALQADAQIQALSRYRSTASQRSRHGHDIMQAAVGGIDPDLHATTETTPLLAGRRSSANSQEESGSSSQGLSPPEWDGARDFEGLPWYRTPSIWWVVPAFLFFTLAFGGTIVPRVNLYIALMCRDYCAERAEKDPNFHMLPIMAGGDNPQCQIPEVSSRVAIFQLFVSLISGILSALVSPTLGALSDRYGRTRVMWASTLGMLCSEASVIMVVSNPETLSMNWILVGAALDGLGGSFTTAMAIAFAYASDCTPPDRRNVAFGYYHGSLFLGIALGPLTSGYIIKATGNLLSIFYIAIGAHTIFLLWLLLVVPESLTKERQRIAQKNYREEQDLAWRQSEDLASGHRSRFRRLKWYLGRVNFLSSLSILWPTGKGTNPALRRNLFFLAAVDTTMFGIAMGAINVVLVYAELMFGWENFESSIYLSIVNSCRVTMLLVGLPLLTRLLRGPASKSQQRSSGSDQIDLGIIRVSILFDLIGFIGYASAKIGPLFILFGSIASIGGIGSPTLAAALTKHVPPDQTGKILGAVGLLHAIARVVAPTVTSSIFAKTVGTHTQIVFIFLSALFGLAFILSLLIRPYIHWDDTYQEPLLGDASTNESRQSQESERT